MSYLLVLRGSEIDSDFECVEDKDVDGNEDTEENGFDGVNSVSLCGGENGVTENAFSGSV